MESININIAGIPTTLVLDEQDAALHAHVFERYSAFAIPPQAGVLTIQLRTEPGPLYIPLETARTWQIRTQRQGDHIDFESHYEKGWADLAAGHGELILRPNGSTENFLRVLYAWRCMEQNLLLLHSAGIISHGRGYVFFGPSGSGKTTVTTLSLDRTVLSDDLVIIRKQGADYVLYGVPFRGTMPEAPRTNAFARLAGVFTLVKAPEHSIAPLPVWDAVAKLARCVPFVMTTPANTQRVMAICEDLHTRVPVRELRFRRDAEFWRLINGVE